MTILTTSQEHALQKLQEFSEDVTGYYYVLDGAAGTGKNKLISELIKQDMIKTDLLKLVTDVLPTKAHILAGTTQEVASEFLTNVLNDVAKDRRFIAITKAHEEKSTAMLLNVNNDTDGLRYGTGTSIVTGGSSKVNVHVSSLPEEHQQKVTYSASNYTTVIYVNSLTHFTANALSLDANPGSSALPFRTDLTTSDLNEFIEKALFITKALIDSNTFYTVYDNSAKRLKNSYISAWDLSHTTLNSTITANIDTAFNYEEITLIDANKNTPNAKKRHKKPTMVLSGISSTRKGRVYLPAFIKKAPDLNQECPRLCSAVHNLYDYPKQSAEYSGNISKVVAAIVNSLSHGYIKLITHIQLINPEMSDEDFTAVQDTLILNRNADIDCLLDYLGSEEGKRKAEELQKLTRHITSTNHNKSKNNVVHDLLSFTTCLNQLIEGYLDLREKIDYIPLPEGIHVCPTTHIQHVDEAYRVGDGVFQYMRMTVNKVRLSNPIVHCKESGNSVYRRVHNYKMVGILDAKQLNPIQDEPSLYNYCKAKGNVVTLTENVRQRENLAIAKIVEELRDVIGTPYVPKLNLDDPTIHLFSRRNRFLDDYTKNILKVYKDVLLKYTQTTDKNDQLIFGEIREITGRLQMELSNTTIPLYLTYTNRDVLAAFSTLTTHLRKLLMGEFKLNDKDCADLIEDTLNIVTSNITTIHKAQGLTSHTVYINLSSLSSVRSKDDVDRLMYVAFSRATHELKLYSNGGF
jgi:hypothetical protein